MKNAFILIAAVALISCVQQKFQLGGTGAPQQQPNPPPPTACAAGPVNSTPHIITTIVGDGTQGFAGDGGPALNAQLNYPVSIFVDNAENLYISDGANRRVRKVTPAGVVTTVAGVGTYGYSGDGGSAVAAQLSVPTGLVVDASGNIYIADAYNYRIRKVTPSGVITTIAGNGTYGFSGDGGPATNAQLDVPMELALDASGNLFIADIGNYRVRRVGTDGTITTVAGSGVWGFSGDGGPATEAAMTYPAGLVTDAAGNLYISDWNNQRIRKVNPNGVITTVVGNGTNGFTGDGCAATDAQLNYPGGLVLDSDGALYFTDTYNLRIRKVDASGIISTVAGNGNQGFGGDNGNATDAMFDYARELAMSGAGDLYITDEDNFRIRRVASISTR